MTPLAQHIFDVEQRRAKREEIFLATRLRRKSPPYGEAADAYLLNISRFGFMARTDMSLIDGSIIVIELPEIGEVRARTCWSMDRNIGGEFLNALSASDYFNLLALVAEDSPPAK